MANATASASDLSSLVPGTNRPRRTLVEEEAQSMCHSHCRREDPPAPVAVTTRILAATANVVAKDTTALPGDRRENVFPREAPWKISDNQL